MRGEEKSEWEGEERERSMWAAARILALRESQPYTLELTSHTSGSIVLTSTTPRPTPTPRLAP